MWKQNWRIGWEWVGSGCGEGVGPLSPFLGWGGRIGVRWGGWLERNCFSYGWLAGVGGFGKWHVLCELRPVANLKWRARCLTNSEV